MTEKYLIFPLRLPPDLHAALKQRADDEDRYMATVVRQAIRAYLAAK